MMTSPPPLRPGDKIGIVSPSGKIDKGILDKAIGVFKGWGLEVLTGRNAYSGYHQFAGTDLQRASDLQLMLDDNEIRAIICSRGGYGTVRIIDMIDFGNFTSNPKWIVGYSDITVLHSHINQNLNIETIHALMPAELSAPGKPPVSDKSLEHLKEALFGSPQGYTCSNHPLSRKGKAVGALTGGNLSVLYSLLGSSSISDTSKKVLFIEDVGEYLYHIDRMMVALDRSGMLVDLGGMIVGGMTEMKDNAEPFGKTAEEIIAGSVEKYDYPVYFGFPAGHLSGNHPLVLGRKVALNIDESTSLLSYC